MKTVFNLILSLLCIAAVSVVATSCNDDESIGGPELSALTYATEEIALDDVNYVSAEPSVFLTSKATFSIIKVTHNGQVLENASSITINPDNGVITTALKSEISYAGEYLVSVRVKNSSSSRDYPDAYRLVVRGITFEKSSFVITRGTAMTIPVKNIHLAVNSETEFALVLPGKPAEASKYNGITIDPKTCAITLAATLAEGVYPISIDVTNLTNPKGTELKNVTKITVVSLPYDLTYTPSSITLIKKEPFTSTAPTVKALDEDGSSNVTFALVNNHNGQIAINPTTGVISLAEDHTLPGDVRTSYPLDINVTNKLGTVKFTAIFTVIMDPNKKIDPITAITYSGLPVTLTPGQPWTSTKPAPTGSAIGLSYGLKGAPEGVAINAKTGIITMTAGHKMPLKLTDNNLTVTVQNSGMTTALDVQVGNFAIDPVLWKPIFTKVDGDQLTNSGIPNMDRYSFSGVMFAAGAAQLKNGGGKSSTGDVIDFIGVNTAGTPAGTTNQNNDWLVSSEISLSSYEFNPTIKFDLSHRYGNDNVNILAVYITDGSYAKGLTEEVAGDENSKPSLGTGTWEQLATGLQGPANDFGQIKKVSIPIDSKYFGKKVRIALQYSNPSATNNNSRTYRIADLQVIDTL